MKILTRRIGNDVELRDETDDNDAKNRMAAVRLSRKNFLSEESSKSPR